MMPYVIIDLDQHCLSDSTKPLPEPILNHINDMQRDFNQNTIISIEENAFKNAVYKMVAILSIPQCVQGSYGFMLMIK